MLMEVLCEFAKGECNTVSELAKRLGHTTCLVEQMLFDLVQRGYLTRKHQGERHCGACGKGPREPRDCKIVQWVLTEKGKESCERRVMSN